MCCGQLHVHSEVFEKVIMSAKPLSFSLPGTPFAKKNLAAFFALFFVAGMFFSAAPLLALDQKLLESQKREVQEDINQYQINISNLQEGIKTQEDEIQESIRQEHGLLSDIEDIDTRLADQRQKLDELYDRMLKQKKLIVVKEKELEQANEKKQTMSEHLQARIKAYYKMGRIGAINVAFSTQTFPELLQFHDSYQVLLRYDKTVFDAYKHSIDEIEKAKQGLVLEQDVLKNFIDQALAEEEQLDFIRNEKSTLLTDIRNQKNLQQQAILEMEKASRELTASLTVLEDKHEFLQQGFLLSKGELEPPLEGHVLVKFGERTQNKMGVSKISAGISIAAIDGAQIKAIFEGDVIYAGYLKGFGNTVIIHHGFNYFTVTSRLEQITVNKGDSVKSGDIIGLAGVTASLIEDGVYFEIRKEKESQDPLAWIKHTNLIIP